MFGRSCPLRILLAAVAAITVITGCSSMQPTPMMPSQPARIGGSYGVTAQQDAYCRQQAYQAAQTAKENNVAKEVGSTVIAGIAGAVIGNALEPGRGRGPRRGPPPRGPGGRPPRGPGGPGYRDPGYGTAGAITGAAVGAAASQSMIQNTQQVYDIRYRNCVAAHARR